MYIVFGFIIDWIDVCLVISVFIFIVDDNGFLVFFFLNGFIIGVYVLVSWWVVFIVLSWCILEGVVSNGFWFVCIIFLVGGVKNGWIKFVCFLNELFFEIYFWFVFIMFVLILFNKMLCLYWVWFNFIGFIILMEFVIFDCCFIFIGFLNEIVIVYCFLFVFGMNFECLVDRCFVFSILLIIFISWGFFVIVFFGCFMFVRCVCFFVILVGVVFKLICELCLGFCFLVMLLVIIMFKEMFFVVEGIFCV